MTDADNKPFMEDEIQGALDSVLWLEQKGPSDADECEQLQLAVLRQLCLKARDTMLDEADEIAGEA